MAPLEESYGVKPHTSLYVVPKDRIGNRRRDHCKRIAQKVSLLIFLAQSVSLNLEHKFAPVVLEHFYLATDGNQKALGLSLDKIDSYLMLVEFLKAVVVLNNIVDYRPYNFNGSVLLRFIVQEYPSCE